MVIHQLIFAHPKPGMTEREFQSYWVQVHAVEYASKIQQIRRYLIDTRIPFGPEPADPLFSGVAEIWLENEQAQLASLQSKEFLEGARMDEPRWAAFWRTVALDTNTHVLLEGPPLSRESKMVKIISLAKRREGIPLETFRTYSLAVHGPIDLEIPGLVRYWQCHVLDSLYSVGEPLFDCVFILWFNDADSARAISESQEFKRSAEDISHFVELRYLHTMAAEEHWILGPEFR